MPGMLTLQTLLKGITLRRMKSDQLNGKAIVDLPSRHDSIWRVDLEPRERRVYDLVFKRAKALFRSLEAEGSVVRFITRHVLTE
jgi:SNF2 family DNA or RNA helicase